MTHRISPDQFRHPLEEIADVERYLQQRAYMPDEVINPTTHYWAAKARDRAELRLEGLDAGLPTVGPYL